MNKKLIIMFLLVLLMPLKAGAQFLADDNDSPKTGWNSIKSSNFKIIYPKGTDSLARVYLSELEKYRPEVSMSLGAYSGQPWKKHTLPVVLRTSNASSNGSVAWVPDRMQMYTIPQWNGNVPLPWESMLAVHEGRHAAQMSYGYFGWFNPLRYIVGQMAPGVLASVIGSMMMEGDAVVAETGLSGSGRGRTADFMLRYMYSVDNGDYRDWIHWRLGSYYKPTPNVYTMGYTQISGARIIYSDTLFVKHFEDNIRKCPVNLAQTTKIMKEIGGVNKNEAMHQILDFHHGYWAENADNRGPYMDASRLSPITKIPSEFSNPIVLSDSTQLWLQSDLHHTKALVRLDSTGRLHRITPVYQSGGRVNLLEDGHTLAWNELRFHPRWKAVVRSAVRTYDTDRKRKRTVLRKGNFIYPVSYGPDSLAVIEYCTDGSERVVIVKNNGRGKRRHVAIPSHFQAHQMAVVDGEIYVVATSSDGMGIYHVNTGVWETVLPAIPSVIKGLCADGRSLVFESDRNGSGELYKVETDGSALTRLTSTRYGGGSYCLAPSGDIFFSQIDAMGQAAMKTDASDVMAISENWCDHYHYPVADALSAQEDALRAQSRAMVQTDSTVSAPKRYSKFLHAVHVHSWAPLWVDYNYVDDISMDYFPRVASLGAMCFFQNTLGTFSGYAGYKAAPDAGGKWFHSGNLSLVYKGIMPVFEFTAHLNDSEAFNYAPVNINDYSFSDRAVSSTQYVKQYLGKPHVSVSLQSYIPLQWNIDNASFGLIPTASLSYSNHAFNGTSPVLGTIGARAYAIQYTPSGNVYPRWGIGVEAKYMDPYAFAYMYGYVPGIGWGQGIKLTAIHQYEVTQRNGFISGYASVLPRGYADYSGLFDRVGTRFTADYAIPFYAGDLALGSVFYIKRAIITPHFDYGFGYTYRQPVYEYVSGATIGNKTHKNVSLFSVGAAFELDFAAFFRVWTPVRLGLTYSFNGGSFPIDMKSRHYVGVLFKAEIPQ